VAGWLPAALVVPVAAVAVVELSVPDDELAQARDVFPLDLGTTWVYDVLDRGQPSGTRTSQVVGDGTLLTGGESVLATRVTRSYTDYPGTGPRSITSWFGVDGQELVQHAQLEGGEFQDLVPPLPAYRLSVREGVSIDYDGKVGETPITVETTVESVGDVEVGDHTFEDCVHWVNDIRFTPVEGEPEVEETLEEWTCPGYGTVRSIDTIPALDTEITEELAEFHGVAGNWYAGDRAQASTLPAQVTAGGTEGFDTRRSLAVPDGQLVLALAWSDARAGAPLVSPAGAGDALVYADRDGRISLRAATGELLWRVQVTPPVMAAPLVSGDRVLVGDGDRRVWALALDDGRALWTRQLDDVVSASPTPTHAGVAVPTEDGSLTMVDPSDGDIAWQVALAGPARTAPALHGDHLLVADSQGTLGAFDVDDGRERWSRALDNGISNGPVVTPGDPALAVVSDADGVLHAYDPQGDERWAVADRNTADVPMAANGRAVVTVSSGNLVTAHDTGSGERIWSRRVSPISAAPAIVGDQLVVITREATLVVLDLDTGRTDDRLGLPRPVADALVLADVTPSLVDGALVFTVSVTGTLARTVMYAVPVDGGGAGGAEGVLLRHTRRPVSGVLNEPAALAADDLLAPLGPDLVRVGPDGAASTLASIPEGAMSSPVVDGDVAFVRVGEEMQAVTIGDGSVRWRVPSGSPFFGTQPAVSESSVVFGQAGTGLVAVDKVTGERRWSTALPDAPLVSVPLALPDGDVVYGGNSLARYDGSTGDVVWQSPDAYPLGPLTTAGGLVFAATLSLQGGSGIGAYDARTGERRWFVEIAGVPRHLAPAVSDGVVVASDDAGTVTAYLATDGSVLWSRALGLPLAATPVAADGRAYLVEAGTGRELEDHDYRVLVLELGSGRFLGAWVPGVTGSPGSGVPVASGTGDGRLLIPTPLGVNLVEAVR
jgi:outer membrane protein assembly factor BamB